MEEKLIKHNIFVENILHGEKYLTKSQIYTYYLQTDKWSELRTARLALDNHRCRLCNDLATQVHHRLYTDVLGEESVEDLTSLCDSCHSNYHVPPTIEKVKKLIMKKSSSPEGCTCPCCEQFTKTYKRKLNSTMAAGLIWIVKTYEKEKDWIHVIKKAPRWLVATNQYSSLAYWGLIEKRSNENKSKRTSGFWKPTEKGVNFSKGLLTVPSHVFLYNNKATKFTEELTDINTALGKKFNYEELMSE